MKRLTISEWHYTYNHLWDRFMIKEDNTSGLFVWLRGTSKWDVCFASKYRHFAQLYSGPVSFSSIEQGKGYIDRWLVQIEKLRLFW